MIKGITSNGFRYKIKDERLDDWDLMEMMMEVNDDDITSIIVPVRYMLGDQQFERLKKFLRDKESGRLKASDMLVALTDILNANQSVKNSDSSPN